MEHDSQPEAYCVHVWIRGIHPMLWRRFLVRSDGTLADLHVVLQIGFDWTDFHLHRFRIRKKDYAVPRVGGLACHDARKIKLADLHFRVNERFLYEYDFCDLWQHQVRIEKRLEIETSRSYPVCVGGQWAGPPEDCGGPQVTPPTFTLLRASFRLNGAWHASHFLADDERPAKAKLGQHRSYFSPSRPGGGMTTLLFSSPV